MEHGEIYICQVYKRIFRDRDQYRKCEKRGCVYFQSFRENEVSSFLQKRYKWWNSKIRRDPRKMLIILTKMNQ